MEKVIDISKDNHILKVVVRKEFIEVTVILPQDLYFQVLLKSDCRGFDSRFDYERYVINDFKQHIFNDELPFITNFTYAQEKFEYMKTHNIDIHNDNNNGWFKTVCFDITSKYSADDIISYINKKSDEFSSQKYIIP